MGRGGRSQCATPLKSQPMQAEDPGARGSHRWTRHTWGSGVGEAEYHVAERRRILVLVSHHITWASISEMISRVDIEGKATMQRTVNPKGVGSVFEEEGGCSGARPDGYWAREDGVGGAHSDRNFSSPHAKHGVIRANRFPAQVAHAAVVWRMRASRRTNCAFLGGPSSARGTSGAMLTSLQIFTVHDSSQVRDNGRRQAPFGAFPPGSVLRGRLCRLHHLSPPARKSSQLNWTWKKAKQLRFASAQARAVMSQARRFRRSLALVSALHNPAGGLTLVRQFVSRPLSTARLLFLLPPRRLLHWLPQACSRWNDVDAYRCYFACVRRVLSVCCDAHVQSYAA